MKIKKKKVVWKTNESFSRRHSLSLELQACHLDHNIRCSAMQVAMHKSLNMTRRNHLLVSQTPLLHLQKLLTASKHLHSSLSSCCCLLLAPVIFLRHPDASFSQSKPLSQLPNRHGPLLRLRLRFRLRLSFRFLSFLKDALLLNSNSVIKSEVLVMGVQ